MANDRTPAEVERARRITARQNPRAAFEQMMSPEERDRFRRNITERQANAPRHGVPTEAEQRDRLIQRGQQILDQRNAAARAPAPGAVPPAGSAAGGRLPFLTPQLEASQLARVARGTIPSAAAAAAIEGRQQLREAVGIPEARERGRQYLRAQREGGARDVSDQSVGSVEARAPRPGVGGPMMTEDRAAAPVRPGAGGPMMTEDRSPAPVRPGVGGPMMTEDRSPAPVRPGVGGPSFREESMVPAVAPRARPTAPRGQFRGDRRGPSEADLLNEREMTRILNERSAEKAARGENAFKKGGAIKRMAKGGAVKMAKGGAAKAPKCMARGGGIESRGKTRGKFV